MIEYLKEEYSHKKEEIKSRLLDFKELKKEEYFKEFMFCLLTPQSNAQKCWSAVEEIFKLPQLDKEKIIKILETRTRFHNNKANYIMQAQDTWKKVSPVLENLNGIELRNFVAENVKGYGLKEAGHFLRNIGKSDNKIAILDRHILRNLVKLEVIDSENIKSKKHYLELEQKFLQFSDKIGIPIDELDLLFWSRENGQVFK